MSTEMRDALLVGLFIVIVVGLAASWLIAAVAACVIVLGAFIIIGHDGRDHPKL
jgi:hypothetical protein